MSLSALALLMTSSLYLGFQWTIRVLVYPQFANVDVASFGVYEREHQRLVSIAVGPLFAALVLCQAAIMLEPPADSPLWIRLLACVAVAAIFLTTAFFAVPLHRRLELAFDPAVHARLLIVDTVRLVAASALTVLAAIIAS